MECQTDGIRVNHAEVLLPVAFRIVTRIPNWDVPVPILCESEFFPFSLPLILNYLSMMG